MRRFIVLLAIMQMVAMAAIAQSYSGDKQIWAKSFIGEKAPAFKVERWISEEPSMEGKFVLIEFWGTWCGPCRKAIPKLNEFHKQFADDLVIIALSDEHEDKVRAMVQPKIEFYNAIDTRALLKTKYDVIGVPHVVIIDPEGIVVWEGFPLMKDRELTAEVIESLIKK